MRGAKSSPPPAPPPAGQLDKGTTCEHVIYRSITVFCAQNPTRLVQAIGPPDARCKRQLSEVLRSPRVASRRRRGTSKACRRRSLGRTRHRKAAEGGWWKLRMGFNVKRIHRGKGTGYELDGVFFFTFEKVLVSLTRQTET